MSDTVFEKDGTRLTVKPAGRLDTAHSPVLEKELQEHLGGVQELVMDFEQVEYISSGGLRVLLMTDQLMGERGGSMKLVHVNQYVREVLDIVGITDTISVGLD